MTSSRGLRIWALAPLLAFATQVAASQYDPPDADNVGDMGTFSSAKMEAQARAVVSAAERRFSAVDTAAGARIAQRRGDCAAPALTDALSELQKVEKEASRYVGVASSTPKVSDREAAMDVVEELDAFALDGYLRAAEAFEMTGCAERATSLYSELMRSYTGRSYSHWRARASDRLRALRDGHPLSPP
jgi:hypothetical protein